MKTLKEIAFQLKRIADSLMMIEITLLKSNNLKYTDVEGYAKNYNDTSEKVSEHMKDEKMEKQGEGSLGKHRTKNRNN